MIEIDLTPDLQEFEIDIKKFVDKFHVSVADALKKVSLDFFTGVVLKTPVDTGAARGNWQLGINSAPGGVKEDSTATKKGGALIPDEKAETEKLKSVGPYDTIWIVNNLPYIEMLENGSSDQAPEGMVALTLAEIESQLK